MLVIPTHQHPFAKTLAPFADRAAMASLAMGFLPKVEISRVEEELGGESKTVRTLEHLHALHPDWQMRFVMGGDLVVESAKWYRFDRIKELAPPIVLGRVGVTAAGVPESMLPKLSSTEVRALCAAEKWTELRAAATARRARLRTRERSLPMRVFILGAGKVGRALAEGAEESGR